MQRALAPAGRFFEEFAFAAVAKAPNNLQFVMDGLKPVPFSDGNS
jgi:hypothetical protein